MLRKEWKFDYAASKLLEAAQGKIGYHQERLTFWKSKREEVLATIRSEGIEVDEKIVLGIRNPKSRDWERGGQVMVRNDLQKDLEEVYEKLHWHTEKLCNYQAWEEVLSANPDNLLPLDVEDWQFFFSNE